MQSFLTIAIPSLRYRLPTPPFGGACTLSKPPGAVIGLHGYRHVCASRGRSLLGITRSSEFAGVPAATQRAWIRDGLRILRASGLNPRIWVAPRHGFDRRTLDALCAEGIALISDGFARVLFLRGGLTWVPQQLWGPVDKQKGLWTICIHPNTTTEADIAKLRAFLTVHADQFTSVDRVLFRNQPATLPVVERIYAEAALRRFKMSRAVRRFRQLTFLRSSNSS